MQKSEKKDFFLWWWWGINIMEKIVKILKKMLLPFLFSVLTFCFVSCGSKSSFTVSDCANEISAEDVTFFLREAILKFLHRLR